MSPISKMEWMYYAPETASLGPLGFYVGDKFR